MFLQYSVLIQRYQGARDPTVPELSELLKAADVEPDLKTYNILISKLMADGDHMKARQATLLRKAHSSLGENLNSKRKMSCPNMDEQISMSSIKNMFLKWSKFMHSSHSENEISTDENVFLEHTERRKELHCEEERKNDSLSSKGDESNISKRYMHRSMRQDTNKRRSQRSCRDKSKSYDKKVKMTKKTKKVIFGSPNKKHVKKSSV